MSRLRGLRTLTVALAGSVVVASGAACSGAGRKVATASLSTTSTTTPSASGPNVLMPFTSCDALLHHMKTEALRIMTPFGLPESPTARGLRGMRTTGVTVTTVAEQRGAGAAAASYSRTNVQEEGVDEPDVAKTDGRRLVTVRGGRLRVVDVAHDVESPRELGSVDLGDDQAAAEVLLSQDRVVVLGNLLGQFDYRRAGGGLRSVVQVVDIGKASKPKVVARMEVDGQVVSARQAGGVVRLVVSTTKSPALGLMMQSGDEAAVMAENKQAIERSTASDWLPTYTLRRPGHGSRTAPLAPCQDVLRPHEFAGLGTVSVLTIDPADPEPEPAHVAAVLGGGRIVYASQANLYVATERWLEGDGAGAGTVDSEVHQFAIPGRLPAAYVASGQVEGTIVNQFSMSEHEGLLRVATTVRRPMAGTENVVQVLRSRGGRLEPIGRLGNLGHRGETIQSVRFVGNRGYVVTFRTADPLYVIDLHDPRRPEARGELQMPGFSSYLHPLSELVLLGIGTGPGERGGRGLQLSLFDVSDPAHPARIANTVFDKAWSGSQSEHHAVLWWPATGQLVVPLTEFGETETTFTGALVVPVDLKGGFGEPKRLGRGDQPIDRSLVVGSRLLTVGSAGLATYDLRTLAERAWLPW